MLITEIIEDGKFVHNYSDTGMKIRQVDTGDLYDDAIDMNPSPHVYEETDEPIEQEEVNEDDV